MGNFIFQYTYLAQIMKKTSGTLLFLLLLFSHSFSQKKDSAIIAIKAQYGDIQKHLKNYDTTLMDLDGETTEGGEAIGYYHKKDLKLIKVFYYGEIGRKELEYYFNGGKLFFALEKKTAYGKPIYLDESKQEKKENHPAADIIKETVTENRYYFKNEKLIRWIDNSGKKVNLKDGTNILAGQDLIIHAIKIHDMLQAPK